MLLVGAVVTSGVLFAGCGGKAPNTSHALKTQPKADPAWAMELAKAATTMQSLESFRFAAKVSAGADRVQIVGEYQAPDRVRQTITLNTSTPFEVVFIGTQGFVKDPASAVWKASTFPASGVAAPTDAFAALAAATDVERDGDTYEFRLEGDPATELLSFASSAKATSATELATVTGTAVITDGQISRLSVESPSGIRLDITYSDPGAVPPIEPPSLG